MRRLLPFTSAIVLVETIFFTALAPLLPQLAREFDLSKGESGFLVASYALGGFLGAIPSGLIASRFGVKASAVLGLLSVAGFSVVFGLADAYWLLVVARLLQGFSGAVCWTGSLAWLVDASPRDRRGSTIGMAMSAAIVGALIGPVLGGAAVEFGRPAAFGGVAALSLLLAAVATRIPTPPAGQRQPITAMFGALRERDVRVGMWLLMLPALLFGLLSVLGPLELDRLGWGALAVTVTFVIAAALEAIASPLVGRWSDRSGRITPLRFGLVGSVVISLALPWITDRWVLSLAIVLAGVAYGFFWAPSMALLSDGWERAGVAHGLGFALMNLAWAPGHVIGSAAGGGLAQAAGDTASYGAAAGLCAVTLLLVLGPSRLRVGSREPVPSTQS